MPTAQYSVSLSVGGVSIARSVGRTGDHPNSYEVSLPAGTSGTLSTRTSDVAGTVTASGHGLSNGDIVDVYWSGGVAYGGTVGTISGDDVPVTGLSGDVLPSASTAVVISEQVVINTQIDGDNVQIIGVSAEFSEGSTDPAHIDFQDSGDATIEEMDLTANVPRVIDVAGGDSNVFTGNPVTHCQASNGGSTEACTLKIVSLEDSTP